MANGFGFVALSKDVIKKLSEQDLAEYEYAKKKNFAYPLSSALYFSKFVPLYEAIHGKKVRDMSNTTATTSTQVYAPPLYVPSTNKKTIDGPKHREVPGFMGRLWRSSRPGFPRKFNVPSADIKASVTAWKNLGISHVMVMLADAEYFHYYDLDLVKEYQKYHLKTWQCPIEDYGVPTLKQACRAVNWAANVLSVKKNKLLLHCSAGIGRTGMLVACVEAAFATKSVQKRTGIVLKPAGAGYESNEQGAMISLFKKQYTGYGFEPKVSIAPDVIEKVVRFDGFSNEGFNMGR